jgi:hypothetical protein
MMLLALAIGWGEVYLICLLVGLVFAIITGVLSGVAGHDTGFGGHDVGGHDIGGHDVGGHDAGAGHDVGGHDMGQAGLTDSSIHFSPLSPVVLAMFVTTFGGVGLLGDKGLGLPWLLHLPMATLSGLVFGAVTFYAFAKLVLWAQGSSQASITEAMGAQAEVIIPIPAGGVGKIAYTLRDRRFTASARAANGEAVANHTMVVITSISGPTLLVRESDEEQLRKLTPQPPAEGAQ